MTARGIVEQMSDCIENALTEYNRTGTFRTEWMEPLLEAALFRAAKEAERRTWEKAVGVVLEKKGNSKKIGLRGEENKNGWNAARQSLITAAKDSGHQVG